MERERLMTGPQRPGNGRRKVRWAERADCGCYVRSGYIVTQHGRSTCVPCALAAIQRARNDSTKETA